MAEPAAKLMTLAEFLAWNPPGDTRYELISGHPVAMAPGSWAHSLLAARLGAQVFGGLRRGCTHHSEAGIVLPHRPYNWYVADVAVTCRPHEAGVVHVPDPVLIVEILSPSSERRDRLVKLPDYRLIPSVAEIALVDSERMFIEVHRRHGDGQWLHEILRAPEDRLVLRTCDLDLALGDVYADIALADDPLTQPGVLSG